MARLEALLFIAGAPLSSRKLAELANLADGTQARTLVRRLNELYQTDGSACFVDEVAGGFQLFTRPVFARWLRRLSAPGLLRLSQPALETLTIIAYRQPVLRAELESVRGVQCGEMLRQLLERDLVRIVGRSRELGRPFLYGTTRKFLQLFGLRSLDDLPKPAILHPPSNAPGVGLGAPGNTVQSTVGSPEVSHEEFPVKTVMFAESALDEHQGRTGLFDPVTQGLSADVLHGGSPPIRAAKEDDDDLEADIDEEDDEEDEDDDDLEESEWEEVEDDDLDEDLDEDEDEDEDWDDDEDDLDDDEDDEDWEEEKESD
ncbi:MAG: SMC-Scp complex subunit ScpB [Planctomycetia bacterium]|nr:SMC-Scp complex subunit ScpB [Planctomycetia bacterium]